jgi:hypothetical protein
VDCAPISGLLVSIFALALMGRRALGRHPRNGLSLDLGRYRVPRVAVCPVCHHLSFLAASGEVFIHGCRLHYPIYNEARLCRQLILLPVRQEGPQNPGMLGGQGDGGNIVPSPLPYCLHPATLAVRTLGARL